MKNSPRKRPTVSDSIDLFALACVDCLSVGQQAQIPFSSSNLQITALKIDKNRKAILERKKRVTKDKNKHKEGLAGLD